jgi:hypothetical protein
MECRRCSHCRGFIIYFMGGLVTHCRGFIIYFVGGIFMFTELSYDTFIFFSDNVLFSMLQNYLNRFLFCDRIFGCVYNVLYMHGY